MTTFQIGALPRSGTAWLASVLNSSPEVFCYHEALAIGPPKKVIESTTGYDYVGDSASSVTIDSYRADVRIAINRPEFKSLASTVGVLGDAFDVDLWPDITDRFRLWSVGVDLEVDFDSLFTVETVEKIASAIGMNLDLYKVEQIINFNIQLHQIEYDVDDVMKHRGESLCH